MSFKAQIITIFVSSPNDVSEDRQHVLDELHAWNQRNGRSRGCYLSPLTWEDLVAPDFGDSAQDVVNVEVGDDYDVFLGLMWGRFGTPTSKAESGTQEEFERALARKTSGHALRISFLFKKADLPFDKTDPEQLLKVKQFKDMIADQGGFYVEYSDDRELVSGLTTIFDKIANEKERYVERAPDVGEKKSKESEGAEPKEPLDIESGGDNEEPGLFDLEDLLEEISTEFESHLDSWGRQFNQLSAVSVEATNNINELSQFGQPDRNEVKKQVDKVTKQMLLFLQFGEDTIEKIEQNLDRFSVYFSQMIAVSKDFNNDEQEVATVRQNTQELVRTVAETKLQMSEFIRSLEGLPRLDKNFVRARNGVVMVHKRLRKKMEVFEKNIEASIERI